MIIEKKREWWVDKSLGQCGWRVGWDQSWFWAEQAPGYQDAPRPDSRCQHRGPQGCSAKIRMIIVIRFKILWVYLSNFNINQW